MILHSPRSKWIAVLLLTTGCSSGSQMGSSFSRPSWLSTSRFAASSRLSPMMKPQVEAPRVALAGAELTSAEMEQAELAKVHMPRVTPAVESEESKPYQPALLPQAIEAPPRQHATMPVQSVQPRSMPYSTVVPASNVAAAPELSLPDQVPANSLATMPEFATDNPSVILTLDNVLAMAQGQNQQIALARERIQEAYARRDRASAMWLPSLRTGLNYNHHEGTIQDVAGTVFPTNRSSFYGGLGAGAVGAASPATPGLLAQFHFADAYFQPSIAAHQASARQFGAAATRNDMLRDAAIAYLELTRAERTLAIALEAVEKTGGLVTITEKFAQAGQGLKSDEMRTRVELARRREELYTTREQVVVASARLTELLHADAGVSLGSGEPMIAPIELVPAAAGSSEQTGEGNSALSSLVAEGLTRRAELAEQKHLVCEAVERMKRERYAPLVPSVLMGLSYGAMGGGLGSSIVNTGDRWDGDAIAFWELRNLGLGEQAARRETASQVRQSQLRKVAMLDQVARQVVDAHTRVVARRERIAIAEDSIQLAEQSYEMNRQRIENAQGLPIEMLQAIQALTAARRSYLDAVIDYNIAQFQLCHATGGLQ